MKVITSAVAGLLSAVTLAVSPVSARVDSYTTTLLRSLQNSGISLSLNPTKCDGTYHGMYSTNRVMTLCYKGTPNANDHDTVLHETIHAVQHCAAEKRGLSNTLVPILQGDALNRFIRANLDERTILQITSHYPKHHHAVELEAFAAANAYTAKQVEAIFKSWCS